MFQSATLKLTGWYLAILMTISVIFSVVIYNVAAIEVQDRLAGLQRNIQNDNGDYILPPNHDFVILRKQEVEAAALHLAVSLFYANVAILVCGGAGAYFLARRTLNPIQKSHEAQSQFVSDASHELRTPLAAMQMELEVALRETKLPQKEVRELLSSNLEEVNKLSRLSSVLLQLSKFEHKDIELTTINFTKLATATARRYDKTGARLQVSAPPNSLFIQANDTSIEELLTILIDNALKYSPENSPITVDISTENSQVKLAITNTGEGIDQDKLPHIFDRFYRASTSRSGQEKAGFGLGLSLAKQIVELHHGTLTATSGSGQPTTFTVYLSLTSPQNTAT